MIQPDRYPSGAGQPALKPESIGYPKATAAVLTVAEVDPEVGIPDPDAPGGTRIVLTVRFVEFPDLVFYTNKTSRERLIAKLGLDETKWRGKPVPLVVQTTNNPKTKKSQPSLWVAAVEEWDGHLANSHKRGPGRPSKASARGR